MPSLYSGGFQGSMVLSSETRRRLVASEQRKNGEFPILPLLTLHKRCCPLRTEGGGVRRSSCWPGDARFRLGEFTATMHSCQPDCRDATQFNPQQEVKAANKMAAFQPVQHGHKCVGF